MGPPKIKTREKERGGVQGAQNQKIWGKNAPHASRVAQPGKEKNGGWRGPGGKRETPQRSGRKKEGVIPKRSGPGVGRKGGDGPGGRAKGGATP